MRGADGPDRRRSLLRLTPAGHELLARPVPSIESAVALSLRSLSPKQVEAALRALGVVAMNLGGPTTSISAPD